VTEPTATLELTAKIKWGSPIQGATVYLNPNGQYGNASFDLRALIAITKPANNTATVAQFEYLDSTGWNGRKLVCNKP
jgi:hypothetical protein